MSAGGVFQLLINEGIEDTFLTATSLIRERMRELLFKKGVLRSPTQAYTNDQLDQVPSSALPTLGDIRKSHILFCDYAYKPFVSIGTQYNKKSATAAFGKEVRISLNKFGHFISDMVVHVRISKFRAVDRRDRVCYTAFPGHKLFQKVRFQVNHLDVDMIDTEDYNNFYQYELAEQDRVGWHRCVGQEVPFTAKVVADPRFDMHQEERRFFNGAQTPKHEQEELDLWIPLLFWFRDYKQALPLYMVNWGLTEVVFDLAPVTDLLVHTNYGGGGKYQAPTLVSFELYTNNIFINDDVFYLFSRHMSVLLFRKHFAMDQMLIEKEDQLKLGNNLRGPIERLHLAFRPMENYRLYQHWFKNARLIPRYFRVPVMAKDPAQVLKGTVTAVAAATFSGAQMVEPATVVLEVPDLSPVDDYYKDYVLEITSGLGLVVSNALENQYTVAGYRGATKRFTIQGNWSRSTPSVGDGVELYTQVLSTQTGVFYEEHPSIRSLELISYGNSLLESTPEARLNYYSPTQTKNMRAPHDRGSYVINFALSPYELQPSGHLNFSSSKETYLKYASDWISSAHPVNLILRATALNFLHINREKGTVKLAY